VRALFLHLAPSWSGGARIIAQAARGLGERGYSTTIVCTPASEVEQGFAGGGTEVVALPMQGGRLARSWRLRRILLDRFVEVVFVHTDREQRLAALALRLGNRGAVVRRLAAGTRLLPPNDGGVALRLAATAFLFSTEEARTESTVPKRAVSTTVAEVGTDPRLHDGIRPVPRASVGASGGARLIVGVTDGAARPRVANVLRTVALLAPRHPELRLALIGRGSDAEDVRMHAAALGITPVVNHLGPRDDHLAVLRAADIGWVTASGDDAALAFLDFMALRVPILAERTPLAQHYVADGIAGVLLPPADPPAMAAIVAGYLAHDEQRTAMGNAGRARVAREFGESEMLDGFAHAAEAARDGAPSPP
jgi:glycosyltransferase involved in cell wall biosynthesis